MAVNVVSSKGNLQGIQGAQNTIPKSLHFMSKADSLPPSLRKIINCGYNLTSVIHKLLSKLAKLPVTVEHRGTKQTPSSGHTQTAGDRPEDHGLSMPQSRPVHSPQMGSPTYPTYQTIPHDVGSCDILYHRW